MGPVASDAWALASVASLPWAVDPDSAVQPTFHPVAAIHHVIDQPVDLASIVQFVEGLNPYAY